MRVETTDMLYRQECGVEGGAPANKQGTDDRDSSSFSFEAILCHATLADCELIGRCRDEAIDTERHNGNLTVTTFFPATFALSVARAQKLYPVRSTTLERLFLSCFSADIGPYVT